MGVQFGLLGPVAAWDDQGAPMPVGAPRHREVLARLLVVRNRVVPVDRLVADLWEDEPPVGAVGAVRTFVAALRRALEPGRPTRRPPSLLVTQGPGYLLRVNRDAVDAGRFEETADRAGAAAPHRAVALWNEALGLWRGPALADFPQARWAAPERARLESLRLRAVEGRADALIATGAAREAVPDLESHVTAHPWREDGWALLATALDRSGRRGDALAVLRRARQTLADDLGMDPGPALARVEERILKGTAGAGTAEESGAADGVWGRTAAAWERSVPARSRARLHATAGLLRELAVTGADGLEEAREHRGAVVAAAGATGDAELAARVIGSYDVPAVWTRADDPAGAAELVRAAARSAAALGTGAAPGARARLLSVVAVESRGDAAADGPLPLAGAEPAAEPAAEPWRTRAERAAGEAVELARALGDPALLAFALNGAFMQSFGHCGLATRRAALGTELTELAAAHGLPGHEILGRLVRLQALGALGDLPAADHEAELVDRLADRHERPLARVFTAWHRSLRTCETDGWEAARPHYARALASTADCGMPGLAAGAPTLVALVPVMRGGELPAPGSFDHLDPGPYEPWLRPLLLAGAGRTEQARRALSAVPRPPHDLLQEALWCLLARASAAVGHAPVLRRSRDELARAATEFAGAGSGLISFGPVERHLRAADSALRDLDAPA
ncbi:BTAD domain-containing putative transcriptional regulator [Streptomyces sp. NPDC007084]|uniref:AfsR/SARP family transcriptional regulator n=1 Tax=Streptomyces sp. NPDC007084 TaxID=3154313 RepID=UPI003451A8D9